MLEPKRFVLKRTTRLRICREQDLKAAIQMEAVFHIRMDPASYMIRPLQQHEVNALFL